MLLPPCRHHHQNLSLPLNSLLDHRPPPSSASSILFFSTFPKTLLSSNPKPSRPLLATSAFKSRTRPDSAIQRIADKLRSLGYAEPDDDEHRRPRNPEPEQPQPDAPASAGEIFVPLRSHLPKFRVGHTLDSSWSLPENPVPAPGSGTVIGRLYELGNEVKRQMHTKQDKVEEGPTRAQATLSRGEIRQLQRIGIGIKKKVKVGKAGITEGIVNGIHERWRRTELVKIVCEDLCRVNMKRTHDLLERKTGGLVIWRSGSNIILYRGPDYKYPYLLYNSFLKTGSSSGSAPVPYEEDGVNGENEICVSASDGSESVGPNPTESVARWSLIQGVGHPDRVRFQMPGEAELAKEADQLLHGLGPRFTDWWGSDPPPVDADLLPPVVLGYRRPFRLLPYGVKPKLTNDEMTTLRRLGRPLPCHFALGRNRKHQGLAASIIRLWERCEIAKVAVKRGFQNTNSELMAEELTRLTGGTLLSRDKYFIVLYRGKDFLPPAVSSAIEERRKHGIDREKCKEDRGSLLKPRTVDHTSRSVQQKLQATRVAIHRTNTLLSRALEKKAAAEKLISEIENRQLTQQSDVDKEGITEEERYMLRKVGIKMKPFLLMGKRGVFAGTVENMHLHWKYRELVKILCSENNNRDAQDVARTLEAESGGILVAVERVRKGYAIIVYRGKNYERPANLRPQTLLNKRQAMKRSIEAQRRASLKLHVLKLTTNIEDLKQRLDKEMNTMSSKKESNPQLVDEEVNDMQKTEYEKSDSEVKAGYQSHLLDPASDEENGEAVGLDSTNISDGMYTSSDSLEMAQHDGPQELLCSERENELEKSDVIGSQLSSVSALEEHSNINIDVAKGDVNPTSCSENFKPQDQAIWTSKNVSCQHSGNEKLEPLAEVDNESGPSACEGTGNRPTCTTFKASLLSNRDRLLLRKQALKMKKRPVLAVGRSNIVSGVAKAIAVHFKKHPLAIVNVKARAKGTPIQELVFKLEQATGAVLVSQEINKVILYRGWGAGDESKRTSKQLVGQRFEAPAAVSPELMDAIRAECGLQHKQNEQATLGI